MKWLIYALLVAGVVAAGYTMGTVAGIFLWWLELQKG